MQSTNLGGMALPNLALETGIYAELEGTIDIHCHGHPDFCARLMDDVEIAALAKAAKMRAVVLKSHAGPTADRAYIAEKAVGGGINIFGLICLNTTVGGLNPEAVAVAIKGGVKAVWMPSMWADNHAQYVRSQGGKMGYETIGMEFPEKGEVILEGNGRIKDDVLRILDMVAEADIMLASGHLYLDEAHILLEEAKKRHISRLVIHTANYHVMKYPMKDLKEMVENYGAVLEFGFSSLPNGIWDAADPERRISLDDVCDMIRMVGSENCLVSTDTGQFTTPIAIECMRIWIEHLKIKGFKRSAIDNMTKTVPARLLGLDDKP